MDVKTMQELLKNTDPRRVKFNRRFRRSISYYLNENDITLRNNGESKLNEKGKDEPLRKADNRVSHNFHQLLVDQEASYLATIPPDIDVEDDNLNNKISDALGDEFSLRLNQLVVDAANAGVGWVHYWLDEDGQFRYGVVPPDQVTPIYSNDLNRKLLAVRRTYSQLDPDTGKSFSVHEYWTDKDVTVFKSQKPNYTDLAAFDNRFVIEDVSTQTETGTSNRYVHNLRRVPFVPFVKNKYETPDLKKYKGLVDVYDNVYNGFVNDIDDVQEVILVLTNYSGTKLEEFMKQLKETKAIPLESNGNGDRSGVDKLTIDIPVEARKTMLEATKSDIFTYGEGIDPADFKNDSNASGTAIKMLYSTLELKAGTTESYFTDSLNILIRAIMNWLHIGDADSRPINQTWHRNQVQNDLEKAQTVSQVAQYSSDEAVAKANPIVDDWQQELKDRQDDIVKRDGYDDPNALEGIESHKEDDDQHKEDDDNNK